MSKYCSVLGRRVVYLECLDCEDKPCRNPDIDIPMPEDKEKQEKEKE